MMFAHFTIINSANKYDPFTKSYLNALTGGLPSRNWISAFDTMIKTERSNGNLALFDFWAIFSTEIQSHARINLVNPTGVGLTEINNPTWTANQGYTFAAAKYLDSNFNPSINGINATQNNTTTICYIRTNNDGLNDEFSVSDGSSASIIIPRFSNAFDGSINETGFATFGNTDSRGMFHSVRNNSSSVVAIWKNGIQLASTSDTSKPPPNFTFYVGARNNSGSATNFSADQISMVLIGAGNINQLNFYNSFQTFMRSIGSAV